MFDRGYLTVFRWKGAPIRLHWTLPLGAFLFGGGAVAPFFWLGFFALVLIHEMGHAILVRQLGHQVAAVDITGFGGLCRWTGAASRLERSLISWGGLGAQLLLLGPSVALLAFFPKLGYGWTGDLLSVFVYTNLWLMALNLLPVPPLDGHQAWQLVSELRRPGGLRELALLLVSRSLRLGRGFRASPESSPRTSGRSWWSPARWKKPASPSPDPAQRTPRADVPQGQAPKSTSELADLFRNIGDQARNARAKN